MYRVRAQQTQHAAHRHHYGIHTTNPRYSNRTKQKRRMEPATTVAREIVSSRMNPLHVFQGFVPPVMSDGSGAMAVSNVGAYSCA